MRSSTQLLLSNILPGIVFTPSNALLSNAEQSMVGKFDVTLTPVTGSPRATCTSMQKFAGVVKRSRPQTPQRMLRQRAQQLIRISKSKDGSLTEVFTRIGKYKVSYSHCQCNVTETRSVVPSDPCPTPADPRNN
jgi:hypothetical protein